MSTSRQLAAIMFTDIVGYSSISGQDQNKALELVRNSKDIQKPLVEKNQGKWLKEMGDGAMAMFNSALDAVNCAIEIQRAARADFDGQLRIGIHLGDVTAEGDDIYGDGVNIASRLEAITDPGGIYISDSVQKSIKSQSEIETIDIGVRSLKNIDDDIHVFAIKGTGLPTPSTPKAIKAGPRLSKTRQTVFIGLVLILVVIAVTQSDTFKRSDEPTQKASNPGIDRSLVVLPFEDMSQERDQEWFSDGLTEELLNGLSRIDELKLISRTSSFAFKGTGFTAKKIADSLGVSYVLEGSVRKAQNQLRVTAQLINARDDSHVWSENYNYGMDSIFAIQEDISGNIVRAMNILLDENDRNEMFARGTRSIEAYEEYLKGMAIFNWAHLQDFHDLEKANVHFEKAIEIDPEFAAPYYRHQDFYSHQLLNNLDTDPNTKQSTDEIYEIVMKDFEAAIRYSDNPELKTNYQFDRNWMSSNWSELPRLTKEVVDRNSSIPGWGMSILLFTETDFVLQNKLKGIEEDPLDEFSRIWASASLVIRNELDSAMRIIEGGPSDSESGMVFKSVVETQRGNYDKALDLMEKAGLESNSHYTLITLLAGKYDGGMNELDAYVNSIALNPSSPIDCSPITLYNAMGQFDRADQFAAEIDKRFLGPNVLIEESIFLGLRFHLDATPNLRARLLELGIDPAEFEQKHFRTFPPIAIGD